MLLDLTGVGVLYRGAEEQRGRGRAQVRAGGGAAAVPRGCSRRLNLHVGGGGGAGRAGAPVLSVFSHFLHST